MLISSLLIIVYKILCNDLSPIIFQSIHLKHFLVARLNFENKNLLHYYAYLIILELLNSNPYLYKFLI